MNEHDDELDGELFASLIDALPTAVVSAQAAASLKERLLHSIDGAPRFEHFLQRIAALTDLARAPAQALLASLDDASRWMGAGTEMAIFHVEGGPGVANAIVGFVRLPAGARFPEHEHLGAEVMLVMQGGLVVDGVTHRAGAEVTSLPASTHSFTAAEGPDLMYLGVSHGGMKIDGNTIEPGDPAY